MSGNKKMFLKDLKIPNYLKNLVDLQDKLSAVSKDSYEDLKKFVVQNFSNRQNEYVYSTIINLLATRFSQYDFYADIWCELSKTAPSKYNTTFLLHNYPLFFRRLFTRGLYTLDDIKKEIENAGDFPVEFYFAPELGLTNFKLPPQYDGWLEDFVADDYVGLTDYYYDVGYPYGTAEYCAITNDVEGLKEMSEDDFDPNAYICLAALYGCKEAFEFLISLDAEINVDVCEAAINGGNLDIVKFCRKMSDTGFTLGAITSFSAFRNDIYDYLVNEGGLEDTTLIQVCESFNARAIFLYVKRGFDVNKADEEDKTTPLHIACDDGVGPLIQLFANNKANPDAPNDDGKTPFDLLFESGHEEFAPLLIELTEHPETPLVYAAANGDEESARICLRKLHGMTKNTQRRSLNKAVRNHHNEMLRLLLKSGAAANISMKNLRGPLGRAIEADNREAVDVLLQEGADPNAADGRQKMTPLGYAIAKPGLFEVLLDHGADINTKFGGSQYSNALVSAIDRATKYESEEARHKFISLILERGADINAADHQLRSPVHVAAEYNDIDTLKVLVERGADIELRDSNSLTPLLLAIKKGSWEAVGYLISKDAVLTAKAAGAHSPTAQEQLENSKHSDLLNNAPMKEVTEVKPQKKPFRFRTKGWQKLLVGIFICWYVFSELIFPFIVQRINAKSD